MSVNWGVVATVKAAPQEVMAFAAHHLGLGARRVWLHFDDPDDPAAGVLEGCDGVRVVRCDARYWKRLCGARPERHQERQTRNATRVFRRAPVDWLAHFDVDEFLVAQIDIAKALRDVPEGQDVLRVEPFEALHQEGLGDDIFTARLFRGALRGAANAENLRLLYGPAGEMLRDGMMSHSVGKAFFRCAAAPMVIHLHAARRNGERVEGGRFCAGLELLHFHAEQPERWLGRLDFRLERGAYSFLPVLQAHLAGLEAEGRRAFYHMVQVARPELVEGLARLGRLKEARLDLRAKVASRGWPMEDAPV